MPITKFLISHNLVASFLRQFRAAKLLHEFFQTPLSWPTIRKMPRTFKTFSRWDFVELPFSRPLANIERATDRLRYGKVDTIEKAANRLFQ
jgi:hypothetical protein